jgi:predicted PurR-regulated permease PerM
MCLVLSDRAGYSVVSRKAGILKRMAEETVRRRRQKRSSTATKLRQQAKIRKIIWICAGVALGIALMAVHIRYSLLNGN